MKIPLKDESYLKLKAFRRMKAKKIQSVLESIVEGSFSDWSEMVFDGNLKTHTHITSTGNGKYASK